MRIDWQTLCRFGLEAGAGRGVDKRPASPGEGARDPLLRDRHEVRPELPVDRLGAAATHLYAEHRTAPIAGRVGSLVTALRTRGTDEACHSMHHRFVGVSDLQDDGGRTTGTSGGGAPCCVDATVCLDHADKPAKLERCDSRDDAAGAGLRTCGAGGCLFEGAPGGLRTEPGPHCGLASFRAHPAASVRGPVVRCGHGAADPARHGSKSPAGARAAFGARLGRLPASERALEGLAADLAGPHFAYVQRVAAFGATGRWRAASAVVLPGGGAESAGVVSGHRGGGGRTPGRCSGARARPACGRRAAAPSALDLRAWCQRHSACRLSSEWSSPGSTWSTWLASSPHGTPSESRAWHR